MQPKSKLTKAYWAWCWGHGFLSADLTILYRVTPTASGRTITKLSQFNSKGISFVLLDLETFIPPSFNTTDLFRHVPKNVSFRSNSLPHWRFFSACSDESQLVWHRSHYLKFPLWFIPTCSILNFSVYPLVVFMSQSHSCGIVWRRQQRAGLHSTI